MLKQAGSILDQILLYSTFYAIGKDRNLQAVFKDYVKHPDKAKETGLTDAGMGRFSYESEGRQLFRDAEGERKGTTLNGYF